MFDSKSLPISPEYIVILQEHACVVAIEALQEAGIDGNVIKLVAFLNNASYYLSKSARHPEIFSGEPSDRFDIESYTISTINAIAELGGTFTNSWTTSKPRAGTAVDTRPTKQRRYHGNR